MESAQLLPSTFDLLFPFLLFGNLPAAHENAVDRVVVQSVGERRFDPAPRPIGPSEFRPNRLRFRRITQNAFDGVCNRPAGFRWLVAKSVLADQFLRFVPEDTLYGRTHVFNRTVRSDDGCNVVKMFDDLLVAFQFPFSALSLGDVCQREDDTLDSTLTVEQWCTTHREYFLGPVWPLYRVPVVVYRFPRIPDLSEGEFFVRDGVPIQIFNLPVGVIVRPPGHLRLFQAEDFFRPWVRIGESSVVVQPDDTSRKGLENRFETIRSDGRGRVRYSVLYRPG
nr:hypothetical protein [Halorientalis regularis]